MAKATGLTKRRICEILDELEAMGAIDRIRPGHGKTTEIGLRLGWKADDEALARGDEVRLLRVKKDRARRIKKAAEKAEQAESNVYRQRYTLTEERVPSTVQAGCTVDGTGNVLRQRYTSDEGEMPENSVNPRAPGDEAERLKKRKEREKKNPESQSIGLLGGGETTPELTDRLTSGDEYSSPSKDWRAAKDWRAIDALVEEKLGTGATDEARELGARVEEVVGRSTGISRRKLDALAGVVGSSSSAALIGAAGRYSTRSGVRNPWPYLLKTLLSAAEELGDEADAPALTPVPRSAALGADDDSGLRADLEAALGHALPRMFLRAQLQRDEQGRKTVVARDGANAKDIENAWGRRLEAGGWRLASGAGGPGDKKGEVA